MAPKMTGNDVRCSFCNKTQGQVRKLIADLCTVGYLAASGNAKNTRYGFGINNCASKTEFLE